MIAQPSMETLHQLIKTMNTATKIIVIAIIVGLLIYAGLKGVFLPIKARQIDLLKANDVDDDKVSNSDFENTSNNENNYVFFANYNSPYINYSTTANFDQAYLLIREAEGDYKKDSVDSADWSGCKVGKGVLSGTNMGISACAYAQYYGEIPSTDTMQNLSPNTAKTIYRTMFWDKYRLGEIRNQNLANIIFDGIVQNPKEGAKLIQRAVNDLGYYPQLVVDGKIGTKTIVAINYIIENKQAGWLYSRYRTLRWRFYQGLSNFKKYGNGWRNRLNNFLAYNLPLIKSNYA